MECQPNFRVLLLSSLLFLIYPLPAHTANYGDSCGNGGSGCGEDFMCRYGKCGCFVDDKGKVKLFYDSELGMCLSHVGTVCTTSADELTPFNCVPNAHCEKTRRLPSKLGICHCDKGYESADGGKRCRSAAEDRPQKPPHAMDQVRPGWNRSGSSLAAPLVDSAFLVFSSFIAFLFSRFPLS